MTSTLKVQPTPAAFLPPDTTICSNSSLILLAPTGYQNYLWNDGSVSSSLTITKMGDYWLQITGNNGCVGKDSISVLKKECLKGFYIPSAFTPNSDGKNDLFRPLLFGDVKKYQFTIYNRWGQVVFHSNEVGKGWDGKLSSINQGTFVFAWLCEYQFEGDELKIERGTVTLIR
jgi:gliding motility-associated-like protein